MYKEYGSDSQWSDGQDVEETGGLPEDELLVSPRTAQKQDIAAKERITEGVSRWPEGVKDFERNNEVPKESNEDDESDIVSVSCLMQELCPGLHDIKAL